MGSIENGIAGFVGVIFGIMAFAWTNARYERLFARLAAVLGWVLGFLIAKAALGAFVFNEKKTAEKREAAIEKAMLADPVMVAVKAKDAKLFENIRAGVSANTKIALTDTAALQLEARRSPMITIGFDDRLHSASDDAVIAYARVVADATDEFIKDPPRCVQFLYQPIQREVDYGKLLSADWRKADTEATAAVIKTTGENVRPGRSDAKHAEMLAPVEEQMLQKFGEDWRILYSPFGKNVDAELLCKVTGFFYWKITQQPKEQAGQLLRLYLRRHA